MADDLWEGGWRKNEINLQVIGEPNEEQQEAIDNGEDISTHWSGPMAQKVWGPTDPVGFAQRIKETLPWWNMIRHPFNQYMWDDAGEFLPYTTAFVQECMSLGVDIHWVLMDGPSWQDPMPPTNSSVAVWTDHMGNFVHPGQMRGHQGLIHYLQTHPAMIPRSWAVEAINEPQMYRNMEHYCGDSSAAKTLYIQHCLNIWALWKAAFPTIQFSVGGWQYSNDISALDTFLPAFNKSGTDALRAAVGPNLFWSLHLGMDFNVNYMKSKCGSALGRERIYFTETHVRGNHADDAPPISASDTVIQYQTAASGDFWAQYQIGNGWWTGAQRSSKSTLMQIFNPAASYLNVAIPFWASYSAYLHQSSFGGHPQYFTGPESAHKTPTLFPVAWLKNPGDVQPESIYPSFAVCFGGRGVCVIQGLENTQNSLHGGDAWNVLYGARTAGDDHLYLGRGGGVIRTFQGMNRMVANPHSHGLIYTGTGKDVITLNGNGTTTIIIDPGQTQCWIWDFDPYRKNASEGDRISFKGVFADKAALRAASQIALAERYNGNAGYIDMRVFLPAGGYVHFQGGSTLLDSLWQYCLDFTSGWYGEGYVEPPDYDPALIGIDPGPNTTDWYADQDGGGGGDGGPVGIFTKQAGQVLVHNKAGSIVEVH